MLISKCVYDAATTLHYSTATANLVKFVMQQPRAKGIAAATKMCSACTKSYPSFDCSRTSFTTAAVPSRRRQLQQQQQSSSSAGGDGNAKAAAASSKVRMLCAVLPVVSE